MKKEKMEKMGSKDPEKIQQKPESGFLLMECPDCTSHQVVFSHASMKVECSVCGRILVEPTGGKARINGEILERYE